MKNCIVKIIDNAFEKKNDEGGLFPLIFRCFLPHCTHFRSRSLFGAEFLTAPAPAPHPWIH